MSLIDGLLGNRGTGLTVSDPDKLSPSANQRAGFSRANARLSGFFMPSYHLDNTCIAGGLHSPTPIADKLQARRFPASKPAKMSDYWSLSDAHQEDFLCSSNSWEPTDSKSRRAKPTRSHQFAPAHHTRIVHKFHALHNLAENVLRQRENHRRQSPRQRLPHKRIGGRPS